MPARGAVEHGVKLPAPQHSANLSIVEGALELSPRDHLGKVEEGPARGSKGKGSLVPQVADVEAVDGLDAEPRLASWVPAHDGHVHFINGLWADVPERRSGVVTQHGAVPTREDCGRLARQRWRHLMAYQIHATMHTMQPALRNPMRDRSSADTGSHQLRTRDDAVLCAGKRRNHRIDGTCLELCITVMHNAGHPKLWLHERNALRAACVA